MCKSFSTVSTAVMASPSAPFGARLNDTVIAGNCPWWFMESGSVVFTKYENALKGTALLAFELVVVAAVTDLFALAAELFGDSAFVGGVREFDDGVYFAVVVRAFDPAD